MPIKTTHSIVPLSIESLPVEVVEANLLRKGRQHRGKVTLRKNCKIGSHSVVLPGVTVGENSIVGAFSFVNSNVPDNVVAVGVPTRVIKRLDEKES